MLIIILFLIVALVCGVEIYTGIFIVQWWSLEGWKSESEGSPFLKRWKLFWKNALYHHAFFHVRHRRYLQRDGSYLPQTVFDPRLGYRFPMNARVYLDPIQARREDRAPEAGLFTDGNGLIGNHRDQQWDLSKIEGDARRYFLIGGSAPAGLGSMKAGTLESIQNHETLAATLENEFQMKGNKKTEVINACVHGYSTTNEFLYYSMELSHYLHDGVIAFHGYNDMLRAIYLPDWKLGSDAVMTSANIMNLDGPLWSHVKKMREIEFSSKGNLLLKTLRDFLSGLTLVQLTHFFYSEISSLVPNVEEAILKPFMPLIKRVRRWKRETFGVEEKRKEEMKVNSTSVSEVLTERHKNRIILFVERQFENDLRLAAVAGALKKKLWIALQPLLLTKKNPVESEKKFFPRKQEMQAAFEFYLQKQKEIYAQREAELTNLGARVIDLTGVLDDEKEEMYSDIIHYTDRGIQQLASFLAQEILIA